jgi:hypothetical protein
VTYRKRKRKKRNTIQNTALEITPDNEEKYINGIRVGDLEITPEVAVHLRVFPWLEDLEDWLRGLQLGQGVNIPLEVITEGISDECLTTSSIISKFTYAVRVYGEKICPEKKFSCRTITKSGGRHIKETDPARWVRISSVQPDPVLKIAEISEEAYLKKQQDLRLKLRKNVYAFLSHLSKKQNRPMTVIIQDLVEDHPNFPKG